MEHPFMEYPQRAGLRQDESREAREAQEKPNHVAVKMYAQAAEEGVADFSQVFI
jgi:hypothetical protein